jgi:hypothetical protein
MGVVSLALCLSAGRTGGLIGASADQLSDLG